LPQWVQERVQQADVPQLERWGERLLDARTLTELFELRKERDVQL
jgi:hypothetical protein